jgi:excinuclease ABC subunit C
MLFDAGEFSDFGPSTMVPEAVTPSCQKVSGKPGALRGQVRVSCPRKAGVYGMVDIHGDLIYVGKAKSLRARLLSYFRPRSRGRKASRIVRQTRRLIWEPCPSEFVALLRELELIRRWRPRWNVQGQPLRRHKAFVCVGRAPAPYAFLTRRPPAGAVATFGPIPVGRRALDAVCRINDLFQLRDCPQAQEMAFPDQAELFPHERLPGCLRFEIGTCLGPCTGTCPRRDYAAKVEAARSFLAGTMMKPLEDLRKAMTAAAEALQFELAAVMRDRLEVLTWLSSRLERLRNARSKMSFIYPVTGTPVTGKPAHTFWYLIHAGRTVKVVEAPRDRTSVQIAREAIRSVYEGHSGDLLESHEHVDGMMLVVAWFRKHPKEMKKTLTPGEALAKCK